MGVVRCRCLSIIGCALIIAGCGEEIQQPTQSIQMSLGTLDTSGQYILTFDEAVPAGFAAQVATLGGTVEFTHPAGYALVSGLTDAAAAQLGLGASVTSVMPDMVVEMDPITNSQVESMGAVPMSPAEPSAAYFYARQWNMRAIDADVAWARGRVGSPAVTVAILDTGIDYTYLDLAGRVDLSRSASFIPLDDSLVATYFPGKHPITDLHYHGTHVANTVVSNGWVVAGVTSQVTLIGVKVCSVVGGCPSSAIMQGLLHAADQGADVVNMSLGGSFIKSEQPQLVGLINSLAATLNKAGVTVVVAAGNAAADLDHDGNTYATFCNTPNTICVSATAPTAGGALGPWTDVDTPTDYTNYGTSAISVAAPGGGYGQAVWAACSQTSLVYPICGTGWYILGIGGTSMASPHVAGLAALVVEDVGRKPGQVRTKIKNGADDLGKPGADPYYGKGRINVNQTAK